MIGLNQSLKEGEILFIMEFLRIHIATDITIRYQRDVSCSLYYKEIQSWDMMMHERWNESSGG